MLKLKLTFFFVLISFVSFLQNSTLSGSIKDSETGELLIGASVFVEKLKQGISSNLYGFYSLTIPNGNYTVKVSFVGYREVVKKIEINERENEIPIFCQILVDIG